MGTFKNDSGRQVSFAVTFTDEKPLLVVYTIDKVKELIQAGNVRAITEKLREWSGSHDDKTRGYSTLAQVGPMSPSTFLARAETDRTLESEV